MTLAPRRPQARAATAPPRKDDDEEAEADRLVLIAEAGGIMPLVALLSSGTTHARENSAGALWHLALDPSNQLAIARANGISPLVTHPRRRHGPGAQARERRPRPPRHQATPTTRRRSPSTCVALLGNESTGTQRRAARVLAKLAPDNPGSPVVIVNAGAISPLVTLLCSGARGQGGGGRRALHLSPQLALDAARHRHGPGGPRRHGLGRGAGARHPLLLTLAQDADNCMAIAKAGAIPRLVEQLRGGGRTSVKAQELAAAVLSYLSATPTRAVEAIAAANGIRPLVTMLAGGTPAAQAHAARVLSDMAKASPRNQAQILSEGAVTPLVALLAKENDPRTKAEAAGALRALCDQPARDAKGAWPSAGAIKPLVALLNEDDDQARKGGGRDRGALQRQLDNQDAVEKNKGISQAGRAARRRR